MTKDPRKDPRLKEYHVTEQQLIEVKDFEADGLILDICGGGEGVIGILKGEQVISTDLRKSELLEAKNTNLKIIMDATDLKFLDETFNVATNFFGFMFLPENILDKVFQEIHRVLKPNGRFLVWDAIIPPKTEEDQKEKFMIVLGLQLPNKEPWGTGYGVKRRIQDQKFFIDIAEKNGFKLLSKEVQKQTFFLEFQKK